MKLLCRLGWHAKPRSQGQVGYCPRGCGNLKREHRGLVVYGLGGPDFAVTSYDPRVDPRTEAPR
jgi:hypothetical protein